MLAANESARVRDGTSAIHTGDEPGLGVPGHVLELRGVCSDRDDAVRRHARRVVDAGDAAVRVQLHAAGQRSPQLLLAGRCAVQVRRCPCLTALPGMDQGPSYYYYYYLFFCPPAQSRWREN